MAQGPYDRFTNEQLILRDELAIDRTILANERTLLAYARTGLALLVGGITFFEFTERGVLPLMGLVSIPVGVAILILGYVRYTRINRSIQKIRRGMIRGQE